MENRGRIHSLSESEEELGLIKERQDDTHKHRVRMRVCVRACTHHSLFPEVYSHCGGELAVELVVGVPVEESGLAHSRVP